MDVVEVCAASQYLLELSKRVTAFRPSVLVRCQVSANDVWTCVPVRPGGSPNLTKGRTSRQISGRVGFLRLAKIGVSARGVVEVWRSEERRVGKECRCRWCACHEKKRCKW